MPQMRCLTRGAVARIANMRIGSSLGIVVVAAVAACAPAAKVYRYQPAGRSAVAVDAGEIRLVPLPEARASGFPGRMMRMSFTSRTDEAAMLSHLLSRASAGSAAMVAGIAISKPVLRDGKLLACRAELEVADGVRPETRKRVVYRSEYDQFTRGSIKVPSTETYTVFVADREAQPQLREREPVCEPAARPRYRIEGVMFTRPVVTGDNCPRCVLPR